MNAALPSSRSSLSALLLLVLAGGGAVARAQHDVAPTRPDAAKSAREADSAGADSFLLGPEDVIEVFVWKEEELSTTATVRPDGRGSVLDVRSRSPILTGDFGANARVLRQFLKGLGEAAICTPSADFMRRTAPRR